MRWVWIFLTTIAVVAAAAMPFHAPVRAWLEERSAQKPTAPTGPPAVTAERQYYVLLAMIEVEPKDADDDAWDATGSGPDLYYEVHWQGQRIFESTTKEDTLVAKWSNSAIRVGDLFEAVSIDDSIKAARITVRANAPIEIVVYDKDVASDDEIGRWSVDPSTLRVTDQRVLKPAPGIVSAVIRVLALDGVEFGDIVK